MTFWKHLYWRVMPVDVGPKEAAAMAAGVLLATGFVWFMQTRNENQCKGSPVQAEAELAEAFRQLRAADGLRTQDDLSCPVYRNFIAVAERTLPVVASCRRPEEGDISLDNFAAYVASVRKLVSERCPSGR